MSDYKRLFRDATLQEARIEEEWFLNHQYKKLEGEIPYKTLQINHLSKADLAKMVTQYRKLPYTEGKH